MKASFNSRPYVIISGINEVKVRGARTIVIAEEDARLRANADDVIVLPKSDPQIAALLGVLFMIAVRGLPKETFTIGLKAGVLTGLWQVGVGGQMIRLLKKPAQ